MHSVPIVNSLLSVSGFILENLNHEKVFVIGVRIN